MLLSPISHGMRSYNFLRLIYNKVTSRSYGYFLRFSYFYFLRKKTQGILGVTQKPHGILDYTTTPHYLQDPVATHWPATQTWCT
jgi:hypothetical protein